MGRLGLVLGRVVLASFGVWVDSALKVSRLGYEWFRLWDGVGPVSIGRIRECWSMVNG